MSVCSCIPETVVSNGIRCHEETVRLKQSNNSLMQTATDAVTKRTGSRWMLGTGRRPGLAWEESRSLTVNAGRRRAGSNWKAVEGNGFALNCISQGRQEDAT